MSKVDKNNKKKKKKEPYEIRAEKLAKDPKVVDRNFLILITILNIIFSTLMPLGFSFFVEGQTIGWKVHRTLVASGLVFIFFQILTIFQWLNLKKRTRRRRDIVITLVVSYLSLYLIAVSQKGIHPYVFPIAFVTLVIAVIIDNIHAIIATILVSLASVSATIVLGVFAETITKLKTPKLNLDLLVFNSHLLPVFCAVGFSLVTSFIILFIMHKKITRYLLFWGSFLVILGSLPIVASFSYKLVYEAGKDLSFAVMAFFGGNILGVSMAIASLPLFESIFKVWTKFKMAEYASFDQPLLRRLAKEAPGTFQHSLAVANLTETCALAINEDPYFARLAGYYHDVGKLINSEFFTENQIDGYNPHDDLIPEMSARIITKHAIHGYNILKKAGLPEEIAVLALEHHGTTQAMYFYKKAKDITEGELDTTEYSYGGPLPSSKMAAILMLCDIVEAVTRAKSMDKKELEGFLDQLVDDKILDGQFDDCDITLQELDTIKKTLANAVPSIYHSRISYDKNRIKRL